VSEGFAILKTAHILSAAVVLGTGFGIAFYSWFGYRSALRSGDIGHLRGPLRLTVMADSLFTTPAVAFQAISGVVLMQMLGWPLISVWSLAVWSLFVVTGACWIPVVVIQIKLKRLADNAASTAQLPPRFHLWFRWWFGLGVPAFAAVVAIYYLMVVKPLRLAGV
jgi:uncharacterized membrane protein